MIVAIEHFVHIGNMERRDSGWIEAQYWDGTLIQKMRTAEQKVPRVQAPRFVITNDKWLLL